MVAQADGPPVFGRLATPAWPAGALIEGERRLRVPAYTLAGDYALVVGLYDRSTLRRLSEGGVDRARLAPVRRGRSEMTGTAIPQRLEAELGSNVRLAGYDLDGEARPGGTLQVDLFWQARAPVADDLTVFVHVVDSQGTRWAQDDSKPARGSYPSNSWAPGEIVRDRHSVSLPADAPPGRYNVAVGLYDAQSGRRLSYRQWPWARAESSVILKGVAVR